MADYRPFAAINNLEFIGVLEGSTTANSPTSVDSLTIPAGKFKTDDILFYVCEGSKDAGATSGLCGLIFTINSNPFSNVISFDGNAPGFIIVDGYLKQSSIGNSYAICQADGTQGLSKAAKVISADDTGAANWITDTFTIELYLQSDAVNTTTGQAKIYKLRGSN